MAFSHALGKVMSTILLTVLWIILFGPYALIWKLIDIWKKEPVRKTYWNDAPNTDAKHMEYQF